LIDDHRRLIETYGVTVDCRPAFANGKNDLFPVGRSGDRASIGIPSERSAHVLENSSEGYEDTRTLHNGGRSPEVNEFTVHSHLDSELAIFGMRVNRYLMRLRKVDRHKKKDRGENHITTDSNPGLPVLPLIGSAMHPLLPIHRRT